LDYKYYTKPATNCNYFILTSINLTCKLSNRMRLRLKLKPKIISAQDKKIVIGNFLSLSSLQGLSYLMPIIILPYLIRVIGPEKFGLIAFAQAFVQYFVILTDYGFNVSATREIALCVSNRQKTCSIFSSVLTVKCVLSGISFLVLLLIVSIVPRFKHDWLVYIFSFGAVIGNTLFPAWFFQGREKMVYIARINIVGGIIYTACIFLLVRKPTDYLYFPLLTSLFFVVTGIIGLYISFRKFGLEFVFQRYSNIRQELKAGWNIFISVVAINSYTSSRVFAIGLFTNNTITGYYSIAERIVGFIQGFPLGSLSQAVYPRLNKIFARNKARALQLMRKIQGSVTIGYLVILPVLFLKTPLLVRIACGKFYPQVDIALSLLMLSVFFVCANAFRVQFLLVCGRTDLYSKLHLAAAMVGLPLIFILTFYFSYIGTALSTLIIETAVITATLSLIKIAVEDS
jgi:PST family polysaccharide transporter